VARARPEPPFLAVVTATTASGDGVARDGEGRVVFVRGALAGEIVRARTFRGRRRYAEAALDALVLPSASRLPPPCPVAGRCAGCALQHLAGSAQLAVKTEEVLRLLERLGGTVPETLEPTVVGPVWGYRRRARLSVDVRGGAPRVGFHTAGGRGIVPIERCPVLVPELAALPGAIAAFVAGASRPDGIPQVELAAGEGRACAVFRFLSPPEAEDRRRLAALGEAYGIDVYLQEGGPETLRPLADPPPPYPEYALPAHDLRLVFSPLDFVQVNAAINRALVDHAVRTLGPGPGDEILDLYSGIGNFGLAFARRGARVIGLELSSGAVARALENTRRHGLEDRARFHAADLMRPEGWHALPPPRPGVRRTVLLDPPRSGANELLPRLGELGVGRLLYVSCRPATLARDAGILIGEHGFRLKSLRLFDMFPHTEHVEAAAFFERDG
jgi:23S rRNA (uracil1939-C5)-methyltransferase